MKLRKIALLLAAIALALVTAIAVDELVYMRWCRQMKAAATLLEAQLASGGLPKFGELPTPPSTYELRPHRQFILFFEPPALVWTYRLGNTRFGYPLTKAWSKLKWRLVGQNTNSNNAAEFAWQHTGFALGVASCRMSNSQCPADQWFVWVNHGPQI